MALTGVMGADFSQFTDAVDRAEVKLRSFESGAAKVESSLTRMGNAFSGQKVIQDATLMAKIFEDMGGAAAFTDKELARMNATATEAVAKLEAMGQDVPDGIRKVAEETKGATKETEGWGVSVKSLALQFGALFTARAAMDFVKDVAAQAGALADLSAQTRISTDDLQIMANAMRDFGVDQDQLGRGLFKLSKQIAGGDDSIAAALGTMGLSLEQVRGMVMSGAAEGSKAALAAERERTNYMSKESIAALDAAGEAYDRLLSKITAWAGTNVLGPVAKGLNDFIAVMEKGQVAEAGWARVKDAGLELLGKQKHYFDDLAKSVGVETAAIKENATETDKSAVAGQNAAKALLAQADAIKKKKEADAGLKDFEKQTADAKASEEFWRQQAAFDQERARVKAEADAAELQRIERKMAAGKGYVEAMSAIAKVNREAVEFETNLVAEQAQVEKQNQELIASWATAGDTVADTAKTGAEGFGMVSAALQTTIEMTGEAIDAWMRLQQYTLLSNSILNRNSLFTSSSQLEEQARLLGSFTGIVPGRARGGPVSAGEAYLVGEEGPELFIPHVGGAIAPGGGGPSITNVFHLVDTESNLARRVSEQIMRQVRAGTQLATT